MKDSQNAAIYNAYKRANRSVSFENKGVLVVWCGKKECRQKESLSLVMLL